MTDIRLEIRLDRLAENFRLIREAAGPGVRVLAVVKADAYGHGMIPAARVLEREGADFFGVFDLDEARLLRGHEFTTPILVLKGVRPDQAPEAVESGASLALFTSEAARALSRASVEAGMTTRVHVKVDTGMGRLGVPASEATAFCRETAALPGLAVEGLFSHFSVSEEADHPLTRRQEELFARVLDELPVRPPLVHVSNTGGVLNRLSLPLDMVRTGIGLYGCMPGPGLAGAERFLPVMRFSTRVHFVKTVPPGATVSYGATFTSSKKSVLATLPVGYANGLFRRLSNRGEVLIRGCRAPLVGNICMNLAMADVTEIPGVTAGDEAVLLGEQGGDEIRADELAQKAGTIHYEILCSLGRSNPRDYTGGPPDEETNDPAAGG
ncbi:MAG: alanine racemase [Pseudomonadota bacterium]